MRELIKRQTDDADIDILVLVLLHFSSDKTIIVDNGTGQSRKILNMNTSRLSQIERNALAGMHSFSGNDYVSSFFRKGKVLFWKKIKSCPEYLNTFSELGNFNHTDLESFVCALYGYPRCKSVDKVRSLIFINKFKSENQALDICNLPPCSKNLLF